MRLRVLCQKRTGQILFVVLTLALHNSMYREERANHLEMKIAYAKKSRQIRVQACDQECQA